MRLPRSVVVPQPVTHVAIDVAEHFREVSILYGEQIIFQLTLRVLRIDIQKLVNDVQQATFP